MTTTMIGSKSQHEILEQLREATRRKAWIGCDGNLIGVRTMDNPTLLRTYRASLRWYKGVCVRGDAALKAVFDIWKELPRTDHFLTPDDFEVPDCCFEKEAEFVIEMLETARQYVRCIRAEIVRRNLLPVVKKMLTPFACGRRGFGAHRTATSY